MKPDRELIEGKIDIIEENLRLLEEMRAEGYGRFESDYRNRLAAKHGLQECIEACLDIANHVISAMNYRKPEDYKDMFRVLFENRVMGRGLLERLTDMAKFRNLLVHRYEDIETKRLFLILKADLGDIRGFVKQILKFLEKKR